MLKERAQIIGVTVFLADMALVTVAFFLSHGVRDRLLPWLAPESFPERLYPLGTYLPLLPVALAIWGVTLVATGAYRSHRTVPLLRETGNLVRVSVTGLAIFTLALWALRLDEAVLGEDRISRIWLVGLAAFSFLFLLGEKIFLRALSRYFRARGLNYRTVVVVGINRVAQSIAEALEDHAHWGFRVAGFVSLDEKPAMDPALITHRWPVLGTVDDIPAIVARSVVDDVVFSVTRKDLDRNEELFLKLQEQGIRTFFTLNVFPHTQARVDLSEINGLQMLTFSTAPSGQLQLLVKRAMDVALTLVILAVTLPVIVGTALVIRLTSRGEVLFRQIRCGQNGRRFTLYKFRTMVMDAEEKKNDLLDRNEMSGPAFKVRKDPRITPVGRILRKFSLDELPQLWNVLKGDMSLVGPRPPIPEEVAQYQIWQKRRLAMKPGLTCLWQISGRNEVDFDRWMKLDLEYIDRWSPFLDVKILLKTIPVVLTGRGAS